MKCINITTLRQHLPTYLYSVQKGNEICITSHGKIIAHIIPPIDLKKIATKKLEELRKTAVIGDIISPIEEKWDVDQ